MEDKRFDGIAKALGLSSTRRETLRSLTVGVLALMTRHDTGEVVAHDLLAKCKQVNDSKKRKKCIRRARRHSGQHAAQAPDPHGCDTAATCPDPPPGQPW